MEGKCPSLRALLALLDHREMDRETGRDVEHRRDHAAMQNLPARIADQIRPHVEAQLRRLGIERLHLQPDHAC